MLADLLSVIGHDLRNPLGVVLMGAAALSRAAGDPERVRKSADTITRASERMNRIIDDLVDYAQLTTSGLILERTPQTATALVAELVERLLPAANLKRLDVSVEIDRDANLDCDRSRVLRLLGHLVSNAMQFTPAGGQVAICATREGDAALFTISDTGSGLSTERLANPFEHRRGAPKVTGAGVGLGLPIARGIVEAHGGRIWLENRPGGGTIARFTLPGARTLPRPTR